MAERGAGRAGSGGRGPGASGEGWGYRDGAMRVVWMGLGDIKMGLEALEQERGGIGWYWKSMGPLGLNWGHWNKAGGAEI